MSEYFYVDNDDRPKVIYEPHIYGKVIELSNSYVTLYSDGKASQLLKTSEEKEEVLLRDPKRIDPFLKKLGKIWKENCPDWRFGQLIENVFDEIDYVPFILEEDTMLEQFEKFFDPEEKNKPKEPIKRRRPSRPRE